MSLLRRRASISRNIVECKFNEVQSEYPSRQYK